MMTAASTVLRGVAGAQSTVLGLMLIFTATPAQGGTIGVQVLSATHSVTLTASYLGVMEQTKTSTNSDPVSDSLSWDLCGVQYCASADVFATADLLEVSATVLAFLTGATGYADSEWTFSPLIDGIADINILGESNFSVASQSASLVDLTANEEVWRFSSTDNNPFDPFQFSETVPTFLSAEHVYVMHLNAFAANGLQFTQSTLRVSGIQAVPDNVDSFVCLCMGLLMALLGKWKLRS